MPKFKRAFVVVAIVGVLCGLAFLYLRKDAMDLQRFLKSEPLHQTAKDGQQEALGIKPAAEGRAVPSQEQGARPEVVGEAATDKALTGEEPSSGQLREAALHEQLPPSPPLPIVPPEASQAERREAFELRHSIDHIVLKDEPFEVDGKRWTIAEIQRQLTGTPGEEEIRQLIPTIQERDIGGPLRKPIFPSKPRASAPTYFGVRVVRPGECVWKIHFRVLQEYLARRQIIIKAGDDEPLPNGRSSSIGRLLKFLEGVVFVYDLYQNRLEKDSNLIHPNSVIVFFKISDLMSTLDKLRPDELKWLRYVDNRLRIEGPQDKRDLLDRREMLQ